MKDRNIIMGIDTSNYTTSVALVYSDGELIANIKEPLPVKLGECGLRQSDAVFAHIKNLLKAMEKASGILNGRSVSAIGVSERPRNVFGSYMPCFLAGLSAATSAAAASGVPLYRFSHQCGHIMAAIYSSNAYKVLESPFLAFHLSGGTTELVRAEKSEEGFCCEIVGGTLDINAGQLIDRVGVAMGLSFPCGKELEALALAYDGDVRLDKVAQKGAFLNLSGLENKAKGLLNSGKTREYTARYLLECIASATASVCRTVTSDNTDTPIIFAGGVMSNSIIKSRLSAEFNSYFAEPAMSSDNAVGIAELTRLKFISK